MEDVCRNDGPTYKALMPYMKLYRPTDLLLADVEDLVAPLPERLQRLAASFFTRHAGAGHVGVADDDGDEYMRSGPTTATEADSAEVVSPTSTLKAWGTLDLSGRYTSSRFHIAQLPPVSSLPEDVRTKWIDDIPDNSVMCLNLAFCNLRDEDIKHVTSTVQLLADHKKIYDRTGLIVVLRGSRFYRNFADLEKLLQVCELVDICLTPMASVDNRDNNFLGLFKRGLLHKLHFVEGRHNIDTAVHNLFGSDPEPAGANTILADICSEVALVADAYNAFNNPPLHERTTTRLWQKDLRQRLMEVRRKADAVRAQEAMVQVRVQVAAGSVGEETPSLGCHHAALIFILGAATGALAAAALLRR
ncbi:hypothetical protein PTSG_10877 [Salpingoeca rosetta]|uniref:Uncharacterized protein n=1 Tax=Salpingoeca rosetta (strain ATCC 50818 / BSB-021) TaxID=946362 RepID=F2UR96_SALR5|nr:uncharacterized protein PTSG_10877 [Salpingoeca rosetta]EGD80199.1 hypothetical protein PTSG_10877 [Salpingoeca rosetta]|eukprot:XP_004988261.1 hypothetical protein PTSG_10877 [Salpingoeca rosetta]